MAGDLVIGIDASTTATKAIAWTRSGEAVAEGRAPVGLSSPKPNYYEQDPEEWWASARAALRAVTGAVDPARIAAVSVSNQRETFAPFGADGRALRPGMVWLDERARHLVDELDGALGRTPDGRSRLHAITGKPVDVIPVCNRILWLRKEEPHVHANAAVFADVHAFLTWRLTGICATSWASADPLGLFDMEAKRWSPEVLAATGIDAGRLPALGRPGALLARVSPEGASATGLLPGTPVVAGGGDGQLAGLGAGALTPERAYLNVGTALVSGIHGHDYRTSQAWRTMGSPAGEGYYYEACVRGGTFTVNWFCDVICKDFSGSREDLLRRLEAEAAPLPPGSEGLVMLPYWQGVMSPYWDSAARGCFIGLSGAHGRGHLFRALMEGLALEQRLGTSAAEDELGLTVSSYVAIGGGAASALWRQIFADVTGKRIERSETVEASALGAGMCAAVGAGWYRGFAEAAEAMAGRITSVTTPDAGRHARYGEVFAAYRQLYPQLRGVFGALDRLAGAQQ